MNLKTFTPTIILIIIFSALKSKGQLIDSLGAQFKYKPDIMVRLDNKTAFISTQRVKVFGANIGLDFNKKLILAAGYYFIRQKSVKYYSQPELTNLENVKVKPALHYFSLIGEYKFYHTNKWEFSMPLILGGGVSFYVTDEDKQLNKSFVLIYEASIGGIYKPIEWFGVGCGLGYRIMLKDNKQMEEQFNSPIFLLKSKIYFNKIL